MAVHAAVVQAQVITGELQPTLESMQQFFDRNSLWRRIHRTLWPPGIIRPMTEPGSTWEQDGKTHIKGFTELGVLAPAIRQALDQPAARTQNDRFFRPDGVSLTNRILIETPDEAWEVRGAAVSLSGYGYLFPWTMADVRAAIRTCPPLLDLARRLDDCVAVPAWRPPGAHRALVEQWTTWTAGGTGWVWAISQSM